MNALTEYERVQGLIAEENRWIQGRRKAPPDIFIQSVEVKEAGGAGDCFFYSLYEALLSSNLKDLVDANLGTAVKKGKKGKRDEKSHFVSQFRNLVAENADDYIYEVYENMCDTKTSGDYESQKSFREYLMSTQQDKWLTTLIFEALKGYSKRNPDCVLHTQHSSEVDAFIQQVKKNISTRGKYIGQIEYEVAKKLLRTVNIYLDVKYREVTHLLRIERRITLLNLGEGHYQYFKPAAMSNAPSVRDTFNAVSVVSDPAEVSSVVTLPNALPPPNASLPSQPPNALVTPTPPSPPQNALPPPNAPLPSQPPNAPLPSPPQNALPPPNAPLPSQPPNALVTPTPPSPPPNALLPPNAPVTPKAPLRSNTRNRKNTMNRTQKISKQLRRVRAAYQFVLDEVQAMVALDKSNSYYMKN